VRARLAIFRRLGSRRGEALTLLSLGRAAWGVEVESRSPSSWFQEALHGFRAAGDAGGASLALTCLAADALWVGDFEAAAARATETLQLGTATGLLGVVTEAKR